MSWTGNASEPLGEPTRNALLTSHIAVFLRPRIWHVAVRFLPSVRTHTLPTVPSAPCLLWQQEGKVCVSAFVWRRAVSFQSRVSTLAAGRGRVTVTSFQSFEETSVVFQKTWKESSISPSPPANLCSLLPGPKSCWASENTKSQLIAHHVNICTPTPTRITSALTNPKPTAPLPATAHTIDPNLTGIN